MADVNHCKDVLDPLRSVCDVIVEPADVGKLSLYIDDVDVYLASLQIELHRKDLRTATRLKAVATASTGLDHLDIVACAEYGIEILSIGDDREMLKRITSTAELTWGLLLCVVRRLPWAVQAAHSGIWARDRFRGYQLSGKTFGIIGYGRLGRMIGEIGKAFRMRILAVARHETQGDGVQMVSLDQLLSDSDVISIHVPLNDDTRGLIGRNQFALMKPSAVLLNTSRGAIVDESALLSALECGAIAGAGLDVIDGEWRNDLANHPLIKYAASHQNLVVSPHIGGITFESQRMVYARIVEKILEFLRVRKCI
jgi:D-3-phosphoglycerate dehydrogenase